VTAKRKITKCAIWIGILFTTARTSTKWRLDPRIKNVAQNSFEVTFNNFGEKKLIYEVVKTEVGWRISNIESPSMNWSLVDVLSGKSK
jgi:hypothetical protein